MIKIKITRKMQEQCILLELKITLFLNPQNKTIN